ncbi:MAG: hypothetical protein Q8P72_04225 [Candidatus Roizmanbacteria bacterium]|nr:hypothetical protein [Candidatus Roizmanbacteria bacterium]
MHNDKVLNARVSNKLYGKISDKAKKNRTTVSTLIRNLVEDALEIHEDIHEAVDKKIRKYLSETEKQCILGYQEIVLAKDTECDNCGKLLKVTETAHFAFFEDRDIKAILCATCKDESSQPENPKAHENTSNQ